MSTTPTLHPFTIKIFDKIIHIAITCLERSYLISIGDQSASMNYYVNAIQFGETPVSSCIYNEGESTDGKILAERIVRKLGKPVSIILGLPDIDDELFLALQQAIPELVTEHINNTKESGGNTSESTVI